MILQTCFAFWPQVFLPFRIHQWQVNNDKWLTRSDDPSLRHCIIRCACKTTLNVKPCWSICWIRPAQVNLAICIFLIVGESLLKAILVNILVNIHWTNSAQSSNSAQGYLGPYVGPYSLGNVCSKALSVKPFFVNRALRILLKPFVINMSAPIHWTCVAPRYVGQCVGPSHWTCVAPRYVGQYVGSHSLNMRSSTLCWSMCRSLSLNMRSSTLCWSICRPLSLNMRIAPRYVGQCVGPYHWTCVAPRYVGQYVGPYHWTCV